MLKKLIILLVLMLTGILSATTSPAQDQTRTVKDMVGRTVRVPDRARRLVSTFKPASLCITALGLQDKMVGIDTDSRRDRLNLAVYPAMTELPAVGRKSTGLNFEAILSLKPDLVILYAQKDGIAIADRLVDHGVATIVILPEKLDQLYQCLRLIADAAGRPEQAKKAVAACEGMIREVQGRVRDIADDQRRRVYFASAMGPFFTTSGDLLQDEIITLAGGINVSHDLKGYFREISPERFIVWNPDLVVGSAPVMQRLRKTLKQPQFAMVTAVAHRHVYRFPSNLAPWDFPSPLSAAGIMWLAARCYPDRFADINITDEIDRYHIALFGKSFQALGGKIDN